MKTYTYLYSFPDDDDDPDYLYHFKSLSKPEHTGDIAVQGADDYADRVSSEGLTTRRITIYTEEGVKITTVWVSPVSVKHEICEI